MADMLITFTQAQSLRPRRAQLQDHLRRACADTEGFWKPVWPHLKGLVADSPPMDHGIAIHMLLAWDKTHGGQISAQNLSYRKLWAALVRTVRAVGFDVDHGRIVGLIENEDQSVNEVKAA